MPRRRPLLLQTAALLALGLPRLAPAQARLQVSAVFTVPLAQQWASRIHQALLAAQARGDIDYQATESVAHADYERVLREQAAAGAHLIVGEVFALEAAARKVARSFPRTMFLMGSSSQAQEPNFSVFDNFIHEPAYLTGMIAGGLTRSHRIGLVGGFPIPEVVRLMNAFIAGVREVNSRAEFAINFINSWTDAAKAKVVALAMIDKGVDILYAERFGVSDAARERKVLAIGNVIDTQPQYPDTVVASALWHMEPSIDRAILLVRHGRFKAEDYSIFSYMRHKGASLAPLGSFEQKIPPELVARVRAREADILAGRFTVAIDESQPIPTLR